jgi:hypothetical protein
VCLGGSGRSTKALGRGLESSVIELEGSGVSNPLNSIDSYIVSESSSVSNGIDIVEVLGGD